MVDSAPLVLPEDPQETQKVFNSLPVKDQLQAVLQVRGKERLRLLFLSEHSEELVQQLPELEIFLTVKEVGERDCLDLIALTTPEQFQYMLDIDLWKKYQMDPEKILHWMEILLESGEAKVAQFIHTADLEFISLFLVHFIHVLVLEGDELEAMDQLPYFTLDQYYFIDFKGTKTREVFEPFIRILHRTDSESYRKLMDYLMVGIEPELEETGYRLRNGRLADYGFPNLEEATAIYQFTDPNSLLHDKGKRPLPPIDRSATEKEGPVYYLTFQEESPFFSSVFSKIDDPLEQDRLKQEIIALCNKAIVAEAIDLSNMIGMERAIKKVYHTLNLGLQYVSQENETKALGILHALPLQKLFQGGVSITVLLRKKAELLLKGNWFSGDRENLVFLDAPHFERMEGVLRKRPMFYREWIYEDFKNLQDISEMEYFLEFVGEIVHFMGHGLNLSPNLLKEMDLTGCHPDQWHEITLSILFLTSLANQILKGSFRFEAVDQGSINDLLNRIFERDAQGKGHVRMAIKTELTNQIQSFEENESKQQHLIAFRDFCLTLFEEEYGKMSPEEVVDPRFVKGLLIRKS